MHMVRTRHKPSLEWDNCQTRKLTAIDVFIHQKMSGVESTSDPHFDRLGRTVRLTLQSGPKTHTSPSYVSTRHHRLMRSCALLALAREISRTATGKATDEIGTG